MKEKKARKVFNQIKEHRGPLLIFLLCSILFLFLQPKLDGDYILYRYSDSTFHISRMLSMDTALFSPTNFAYFQHLGIPINIMYPWIFLLPWRLIYILVPSPLTSYFIYMSIVILATLMIAYYVAYQLSENKRQSTTVAMLYTFAFYHLLSIVYRMSIGEILSAMVMPLLLLALYRIFFEKKDAWILLAITMTTLCYTHYLSLMMYALIIVAFMVLELLHHRLTFASIKSLIKATVMTILLGAGSLISIYYGAKQGLLYPMKGDVPSRVLSFSKTFNDIINTHYGIGAFSIGLITFVLGLIAIIYYKQASTFNRYLIGIGWICFLAALPIFDWNSAQSTFIGMVQFPWRFYNIATLCFCYVGVQAIFQWLPKAHRILMPLFIALTIFNMGFYTYQYEETVSESPYNWKRSDWPLLLYEKIDDQTLMNIVENKTKWRGSGQVDYEPKEAKDYLQPFTKHQALIDYHYQKIPFYATDTKWQSTFVMKEQGRVILPVFYSQGIRVTVNGENIQAMRGFNGGTALYLPAGKNTIKIRYSYPFYVYGAWCISLLSFAGFILYCRKNKK